MKGGGCFPGMVRYDPRNDAGGDCARATRAWYFPRSGGGLTIAGIQRGPAVVQALAMGPGRRGPAGPVCSRSPPPGGAANRGGGKKTLPGQLT